MAEVRSEYERKLHEVDAAFTVQAEKEEATRRLVVMNCLLAKTFKSEYLDRSSAYPDKIAATDTAAVRARSSQHSMQQQQEVQPNTHMKFNCASTLSHRNRVSDSNSFRSSCPYSALPHHSTKTNISTRSSAIKNGHESNNYSSIFSHFSANYSSFAITFMQHA